MATIQNLDDLDRVNDVTSQLRCVSGSMSEFWLHVSQSALIWIIGLMYVALCFVCGFGLKVGVITWVQGVAGTRMCEVCNGFRVLTVLV